MERTLSIIKPEAVEKGITGKIVSMLEDEGIRIKAMKMVWLTKAEAERFYDVHRGKPFFDSLTTYMSSGPIVAMVLEGENVIERNRKIMGATNPKDAEPGTIRALYGENIERNAIHGSDSPQSAEKEIKFFFSDLEIF